MKYFTRGRTLVLALARAPRGEWSVIGIMVSPLIAVRIGVGVGVDVTTVSRIALGRAVPAPNSAQKLPLQWPSASRGRIGSPSGRSSPWRYSSSRRAAPAPRSRAAPIPSALRADPPRAGPISLLAVRGCRAGRGVGFEARAAPSPHGPAFCAREQRDAREIQSGTGREGRQVVKRAT